MNSWIVANNRVGKRRMMEVKYMKSQGVAPFAHPTGLFNAESGSVQY